MLRKPKIILGIGMFTAIIIIAALKWGGLI